MSSNTEDDLLTEEERNQIKKADEFINGQEFENINIDCLQDKLSIEKEENPHFF